MAKTSFKLRPTKDKGAKIQLFFNYGEEKRLRYSTGQKILNRENWNEEKMRIREVREEKNYGDINNLLNRLQTAIEDTYHRLVYDKQEVTNEVLKEVCDNVCGRRKAKIHKATQEKKKEFFEFFDWYVDYYSIHTPPTKKKKGAYNKGTLKTYRNALRVLKDFSKDFYPLTFDKITLEFHERFLQHMEDQEKSANYTGTVIKILKTIMDAAYDRRLHNNLDYKRRSFSKPGEDVVNIYLNTDELLEFERVDLSNVGTFVTNSGVKITQEKMELARDLFLIGANTGLRVSNFNRLTPENIIEIEGKSYFEVTAKGGKIVTVPINRTVKRILAKRNGNPPPSMPEQHINYAIKKIGKLAGITEFIITKIINEGAVDETIIGTEKYKKICTHTARRSFCTNAYEAGMPVQDIMVFSGHSTEKTFYKYIKSGNREKAKRASKHKFFDDTSLKVV